MIFDHLTHSACYFGLGPRLERGLRFLSEQTLETLPDGCVEIDGDRLYANVAGYETKAVTPDSPWEAHRRYVDIQCLVSGVEKIGYADQAALKVTQAYDAAKDCELLRGRGDFLILRPRCFVVFFPQDAHLPGRSIGRPAAVRKVVVKIHV